MKILILGGYGVFGGRLAELLSDIGELEMFICGRNADAASNFCDVFQGVATVRPVQLDRTELDRHIETLKPDIVVDASGPFQDYGENRYSVIEACIQARVNYMDFADAADFVFGVSKFDQAACDAGVFVLSGVSSFPVLTAAVLRELSKFMDIVSVRGGIAPSPNAGVGQNVLRAVIGYAGAPVKLTRAGVQTTAPGLVESMRYTIAVPGKVPLKNTHFSLVDVPDLQVLPPEYPGLEDIWMGAGPVPESLHRVLNVLALAREKFKLPSLAPLAELFHWGLNLMKFGEHRGGMFVHACGLKDGVAVERSWHLLAEGDDGPYIPSMAIEAVVRKLLKNEAPSIGARPATRALELDDYEPLFAKRTIYTGFRNHKLDGQPLYRRILGDIFDTLPAQIQAIHDDVRSRKWQGFAEVRRGEGILSKVMGSVIGFPKNAKQTPVTVEFNSIDGEEHWLRTFGKKSFSSVQSQGIGRNEHLLVERFGLIKVALALVVKEEKLFLVPRRWTLFGISLPKSLMPNGTSFEAQVDGRFQFDVEISAPFVGLIVSYQGELVPVS